MTYSRYAIYYLPPDGPFAKAGHSWLGWDAARGQAPSALEIKDWDTVTAAPRKYGFHGTLKPPFRLAAGCNQDDLAEAVATLAMVIEPAQVDGLELAAKIHEMNAHANLPLIMLSSVTGIAELPAYKSLERITALHKPANTLDLCTAILKLTRLEDHQKKKIAHQNPSRTDLFGEGYSILLAEDNETNQLLMRRICEKAGFVVIVAANGQDAVDLYKENPADIIFMDWSMPVMNGLEATRAIRALECNGDRPLTPIIGLSANAMDDHKEQGIAAGMDAYLTKPINKDELFSTLQNFIRKAPNKTRQKV